MKKHSILPILAILSFLLCAFSGSPVSAKAGDEPEAVIQITTKVKSDGSGTFSADIFLSETFLDLMDFAGVSAKDMCNELEGFNWTQEDREHGEACVAEESFADLKELENLLEDNFSGTSVERLEIEDDHFYYDLKSTTDFSSGFYSDSDFDIEAWWVLEVPGKVVSTNATKTDGRTLTWDLTKLDSGDHLRAESELGGILGLDPAVAAIVGILVLGCCCMVVVIAGVVVFIILRRKK
jgi:hypothetical protein